MEADYSRWGEVRLWADLDDFVAGATLDNGVDVVRLPSGDHLDVLIGGHDLVPGQAVPAFFTGAMPSRADQVPPFFSGVNLASALGGRYLAFSDPLVAAEREVSLGWYAGRAGDHVQEAVAAVLELVHHRWGRELLLVGGSGGGFAALEQLRRARVPVSAFVWNPQTDILRYLPAIVDTYLSAALGIRRPALVKLSDDERHARADTAGIALAAVGRPISTVGAGGRALVLQNASDWHVADHMGPYLDASNLKDHGGGLWVDGREAWLVSAFGEGHAVPPRAVLKHALAAMVREDADTADVARTLRREGHTPATPQHAMPVDLRGGAPCLRRSGIRAVRDVCGVLRVWLQDASELPAASGVKIDIHAPGQTIRRDLPRRGLAVLAPKAESMTVVLRDRFGHVVDREVRAVADVAEPGTGVFIVGSCVSRDAFPLVSVPTSLVAYEARQSLISAFAAPVPLPAEHAELTSPFQRRMFEADHASALADRVRQMAPATDLLVWDIVDERLGVFIHADGGVTTDTVEWRTLHPEQTAPAGARHIPFGTPEHLSLFREALTQWRALLDESGLRARTVLLAPPWAARTTSGKETGPSFGVDADAGNNAAEPYLEAVQELVGVDIIGRDIATRAGENHQWGPAPFHFDEETEQLIADEVVKRLPVPPPLGGIVDGQSGVSVSAGSGGPGAVVVGARVPRGAKVAFHLFRGADRLSTTAYGTARGHTFWRLDAGRYLVRVFVLFPDGTRASQASVGVTLS